VLAYSFVVEGKPYGFFARDKGYETGYPYATPGELFKTLVVWVVEKPAHLVLKADLTYRCGEYADSFRGAYLHAFRPGPWLRELLSIAERVKEDERQKHEQWRKDRDRETAKRQFT